ncbi:MAG: hypothetical protein A3F09_00265 [Chlamydiae bacterium RIFCSPHIGHO2_12_FULL_49_11]|nr:MAG: hypothetical protein A3F09_00265 [Chlamydiae bacterium RIFCSPHIGHO2_12_FULL_49_11]
MPDSGGSAAFSRKAFNDLISFIAGWALLLDYIVTIAISAYSVSPYLSYFFPFLQFVAAKLGLTLLVIAFLYVINFRGAKHSTRLSMWLTGMTLITQFLIVVIGFIFLVHLPTFFSHLTIGGLDTIWSPSWPNFWRGVTMAMVAYTGVESMSQLSAEATRPGKTVPRAIMISMAVLLFMYVGTSTVALSAVTPEVLSTTYLENPIAGIVSALPLGANVLGPWVGLLAAVILIVAANAGLIGASRVSFNMGEYFQLPRFFYTLHKTRRTPVAALAFFAVLAGVVVVWSRGSLAFLADLYNFGAMLAFFCAHLSLILHRIRFPDMERPFKVKGNIRFKNAEIPVMAVIGAIATFSVWCMVLVTKPDGRNLGILWVAAGLVMYLIYRRSHHLPSIGNIEIAKVKVDDFEEVKVKKILLPTRGHLATDTVLVSAQLAKMYGAELVAVHIVEVPFLMPLSTTMLQKQTYSREVLDRVEAIAREQGVNIKTRMYTSRSVTRAILSMIEKEDFDLVVLGTRHYDHLGPVTEKIMKEAKCRVWVCRARQSGQEGGEPSLRESLYRQEEKD